MEFGIALKPERFKNENFENYKIRRKNISEFLKKYLKGRLVWDSDTLGTYKRR